MSPLPPVNAMAERLWGRSATVAIGKGECVRCRNVAAVTQWSQRDQMEWRISGICPDCWDALFPEDDDDGGSAR